MLLDSNLDLRWLGNYHTCASEMPSDNLNYRMKQSQNKLLNEHTVKFAVAVAKKTNWTLVQSALYVQQKVRARANRRRWGNYNAVCASSARAKVNRSRIVLARNKILCESLVMVSWTHWGFVRNSRLFACKITRESPAEFHHRSVSSCGVRILVFRTS